MTHQWWPRIDMEPVLAPQSGPSTRCEAWGDHPRRIGETKDSFSFEDPGWQVIFKHGSMSIDVADRLATQTRRQFQAATALRGRGLQR